MLQTTDRLPFCLYSLSSLVVDSPKKWTRKRHAAWNASHAPGRAPTIAFGLGASACFSLSLVGLVMHDIPDMPITTFGSGLFLPTNLVNGFRCSRTCPLPLRIPSSHQIRTLASLHIDDSMIERLIHFRPPAKGQRRVPTSVLPDREAAGPAPHS